jgi:hypothetical protein
MAEAMLRTAIAGSLPKPSRLAEPERLRAAWKLEAVDQAAIDEATRAWRCHDAAAYSGDSPQARGLVPLTTGGMYSVPPTLIPNTATR